MVTQPRRSTLFPYTTLFRSHHGRAHVNRAGSSRPAVPDAGAVQPAVHDEIGRHTSELQSPCNLVCRLLLVKKMIALTPVLAKEFLYVTTRWRHSEQLLCDVC